VAGICAGPAIAEEAAGGSEETSGGSGLEPIPLELPPPVYGGTPLAYWSEHLEVRLTPREPFLAPKGTSNVAAGKAVTASAAPEKGKLEQLTDGIKEASDDSYVELPEGTQYVEIDLGALHKVYAVVVWHFHAEERVYFDVVCRLAKDSEFTEGVQTLYNNDYDESSALGKGEDAEYIETNEGLLVDAGGAEARFLRLYSNGNTTNDFNHYTEIEVFAKPSE
jgi:hypothetical protein